VVVVPKELELEAAAALPTPGAAALVAVADHIKPKRGDRVLVTGALGNVGRAATFALKKAGATVVAGVRAASAAKARALGLEVLVMNPAALARAAKTFDGVVDTVGPALTAMFIPLIRDGGMLAAIAGLATGTSTEGSVDIETVRGRHDAAILAELATAAARGDLSLPIATRLPLSQAAEGHRIAGSVPGGKVILVP
jgi:NADPH:quinone reductase-like Zn-dependent oxidoreductase